jgi:hypothetical protein
MEGGLTPGEIIKKRHRFHRFVNYSSLNNWACQLDMLEAEMLYKALSGTIIGAAMEDY